MQQLDQAFAQIPEDPRTGYPAGYLSFALELECRIATDQPVPFLRALKASAQGSLGRHV